MVDIDIEVSDETKPDYEIADNFCENLVDTIRADMVGNEEVYLITHLNYATGLFPVADHYNAQIITGSSSEGKSAVKQKVDRRWPKHWLLRLTDMSEKGAIDDTRFNNRYIFAGDELNKLPKNAREILKSCVTPDHEVLTPNGLVGVADLDEGDEVCSWNPETHEVEVKSVTEMVEYPDYRGDILDINTRDISLSMSPNHRLYGSIGARGGNNFVERRADETDDYRQYQLPSGQHGLEPRSGSTPSEVDITQWYDGDIERDGTFVRATDGVGAVWRNLTFETDEFVRLLAWYVTEGSAFQASGEGYQIVLTQKNDTSIKALLRSMGLDYGHSVRDGGVEHISIGNKILHDVLVEQCGARSGEKRLPEWVFELGIESRQTLLDTLMKGDGDARETSHRYTTTSEDLRDDVLRLAFSLGITANYTVETYEKDTHSDVYRVRCNRDWQNVQTEDAHSWRTAEDGIYCPVVEDNATFIAGRNGNLSVIGNTFGDDADEEGWGYTYVRNTSQEDGDDDHEEKKKQTMPFVVLMADENKSGARDWELDTRMMETKVESDQGINEAVSETMWDVDHVTVPDREFEYEFTFEEGKNAVDRHIANIPRRPYRREEVPEGWMTNQEYAHPVIIPNDPDRKWPVDGGERYVEWKAHDIAKPMMPFGESDSKRSSKLLANMVRGSALLNYHNRERTEVGGIEHYIAEPQDLGNVIAVRSTLMAETHDLDDKKMAVIEALTDEHNGVGGIGPNGGLQAPVQDIAEYIDDYADVSSLTEDQLRPMLEQMANRFLMSIHEGEGENGAHLYEYHGGNAFGHPNIDMYPEAFENVTDPIRKQHISETIREHKEALSSTVVDADDIFEGDFDDTTAETTSATADTTESESRSAGDSDDLSDFGIDTGDGSNDDEKSYDDVTRAVHDRLCDTLDDTRVESMDDLPTIQHMLGISPVEYYTDDRGLQYVRAERERQDGDRRDTVMDPSHHLWGDVSDEQIESRVTKIIASLRSDGVFEVEDDAQAGDDTKYLIVNELE